MGPGDAIAAMFLFGGLASVGIAFSPIGRALADRVRGRVASPGPDQQVYDELDALRRELAEIHERLDFTERLLTQGRESGSER